MTDTGRQDRHQFSGWYTLPDMDDINVSFQGEKKIMPAEAQPLKKKQHVVLICFKLHSRRNWLGR